MTLCPRLLVILLLTLNQWVSEGFVAPESSTTTTTKVSSPSAKASKAAAAAQFFQPHSQKPSSASTTLSTVVSVAPAPIPTTTSAQPITTTTTTIPPPPAAKFIETKISTTTTVAAPEPTPVSVYTPPAAPVQPTTTQAPVPAAPVVSSESSSGSSSGSSGGACSEGNGCEGDITYYEAGLGACGWTTDGETEDVIALSHLLMGTQSNGNPFCGKYVTITLGGKSITAKVVDKCMGCEIHAIDLSNHAFKQLEDMGVGRTQAKWHFN